MLPTTLAPLIFLRLTVETLHTTLTVRPAAFTEPNLNFVLDTLSSNASRTDTNGFYKFSTGDDPSNTVYGLFFCRGDLSADVCKECVADAHIRLLDECPNQKAAIALYEECLVRFSDPTINSKADLGENLTGCYPFDVPGPDWDKFKMVLINLLHNAADEASFLGQKVCCPRSYCLPKTSSSLGHIDFGNRARSATSSSGLKFTNLKESPQNIPRSYNRSSLYFLELLGISVAGSRLDVSPTIFTSVGTVIDSGTSITYLPPLAYTALSTKLRQSMADYPQAPAQEKFDTCYDMTGNGRIQLPEITLHFGCATDVSLNPLGIVLITKKNPYICCLGFAANKKSEDLTVIGIISSENSIFSMT
ncbi:aspartyl protease family protein At5g10770-like [Coffea eugenioides]|uniref:aspartyl protease family protein At5g10770-like n=1 Tax=Coffea eugenioides TaxID=49369 RepID=UPI000F60B4D3|nr:aspartyl protease family protein At5g10770-like [Coffea eugenioides]